MKTDFHGKESLGRIKAIAKKESLHIIRDLRSLLIVLLMPIVMLILYGYALNFDIKNVRISIIDLDNSSTSRHFAGKITASSYFKLIDPITQDISQADRNIRKGRITLALVIPHKFSTDILKNRTTTVQVLADGADPNTVGVALGYLSSIISSYSGTVMLHRVQQLGMPVSKMAGIRVEPRIWFNQEMRSAFYIVPGLIAIIMMLTAALLTSLTIVREKESGTFEQLAASPVRPMELMIGKLLPYILIGLADVIIITLLGGLIFNVPFRGNLVLLGVFSLLFIFCALGIGLLASSLAPNQTVAVIGTVFITVLPSVLLSGFVFSVDSMPLLIQPFSYVVPAKYFLSILRALFLKDGVSVASFFWDGLALAFFGTFLLLLASKRIRKNLE